MTSVEWRRVRAFQTLPFDFAHAPTLLTLSRSRGVINEKSGATADQGVWDLAWLAFADACLLDCLAVFLDGVVFTAFVVAAFVAVSLLLVVLCPWPWNSGLMFGSGVAA